MNISSFIHLDRFDVSNSIHFEIFVLQEVNFGMMDATGGKVLEALETYLSSTLIPALKAQSPDVSYTFYNFCSFYIGDNLQVDAFLTIKILEIFSLSISLKSNGFYLVFLTSFREIFINSLGLGTHWVLNEIFAQNPSLPEKNGAENECF